MLMRGRNRRFDHLELSRLRFVGLVKSMVLWILRFQVWLILLVPLQFPVAGLYQRCQFQSQIWPWSEKCLFLRLDPFQIRVAKDSEPL